MILESIFDHIKNLLLMILSILPDMSDNIISLPTGLVAWFTETLQNISTFFPVSDFIAMLSIWLVFSNFKFAWRAITRIWDALPFT
jgi:hypothetical protein